MRLNFFTAVVAGILAGSAVGVTLSEPESADLALLAQLESEAYLEKQVTAGLQKLGKKVEKQSKEKAKAAAANAAGGKTQQQQTSKDAKKKASKTDKVQEKANKQIDEILNKKPVLTDKKAVKEAAKAEKKEAHHEKDAAKAATEPKQPVITKTISTAKGLIKEGTPAKTKIPKQPAKPGEDKPIKKVPAAPKEVIKYIRAPQTPAEKAEHDKHK